MKNLERTKSTILLKTLAILVSIAMLSACETEDFTWQEAVDCCNELELAGYSDWRLPDV